MNEGLASNQLIYVRPQRVAIGKAVVTLAIVVVILSGTLTLLIVTPESIVHQAIATATTTTTITKITSNATTKATLGVQSQCVFTQTCGAVSASGLELILSLNQTTVRPNGTLTVSVTELNTLPTTNDVSSSSEWRLSKLKW